MMDLLRLFFENLAQDWDAMQSADRDLLLNQLLAPFDAMIGAGEAILDVGTGTGAIIPVIKARYPHCPLYSIDLATQMLRRARLRDAQAHLIQADVHALPFMAGCFASVICHNSFPHFGQKPAALLLLKQVLKPGGCLFILHDMSREKVNDVHQHAQAEIIHNDILPSGEALRHMLVACGYQPLHVADDENHYAVCAQAVM